MALKDVIGEYGLVIKIDVSDLDRSVKWYSEKLHFQLDDRYSTSTWRQLKIPEVDHTAIGLQLNSSGVGSGREATTFVVADIVAARDGLILNNVEVNPVTSPGGGVKLAFFCDPDGNNLGLRQNHTND